MNTKQLIKKCLINDDAIVTYPFKDKNYDNTPILRHKSNNKWFGVIFASPTDKKTLKRNIQKITQLKVMYSLEAENCKTDNNK